MGEPVLAVTDFRYRIVLMKEDVGSNPGPNAGWTDVFEISLDILQTEDVLTGSLTDGYEVELEIISDAPVQQDLTELFRLAGLLQNQFGLEPSTVSKGGSE